MITKNLPAMLMLAVAAAVSLNTAASAQQVGSSRIRTSRLTTQRTRTPSPTIRVHDHRGEKPNGTTTRGGTQVPPPRRSVSNRSVSGVRQTDPIHLPQPIERVKHVKKGGWRTLENIWNAKATIVFDRPVGAKVKIRYGSTKKYFGKDRQKKSVEANRPAVLNVGRASAVRARVQIYVERDTDVTYFFYPGGVNSVNLQF
jgi:hypothetical protein